MAHGYSPEACNIFGWRSIDNGVTWKEVDTSALGPNKAGSVTGHIEQLPGKKLMAVGHYLKGCVPYVNGIWCAISEDDGLTWGEPRLVSTQPGVEPVVVRHQDRLFIFIRGGGVGPAGQYIAVSDDWGNHWDTKAANIRPVDSTTRSMAHPFAMVNPHQPKELIAITFERGTVGSAQLWSGDPQTRVFTHVRRLLDLSKQSVAKANDYG
jgi:hypothetical protein